MKKYKTIRKLGNLYASKKLLQDELDYVNKEISKLEEELK